MWQKYVQQLSKDYLLDDEHMKLNNNLQIKIFILK
jgi:hypothetical protein